MRLVIWDAIAPELWRHCNVFIPDRCPSLLPSNRDIICWFWRQQLLTRAAMQNSTHYALLCQAVLFQCQLGNIAQQSSMFHSSCWQRELRTPQIVCKRVLLVTLLQCLCTLWRHRLIGIRIPIMNMRRWPDRLMFIMGIPISIRRLLFGECRRSWIECMPCDNEATTNFIIVDRMAGLCYTSAMMLKLLIHVRYSGLFM